MGMAQIGGEHRKALFHINSSSVPMQKRDHCKAVTKVMDTRTMAVLYFSEANPAG
jgi:hypothetical protein